MGSHAVGNMVTDIADLLKMLDAWLSWWSSGFDGFWQKCQAQISEYS